MVVTADPSDQEIWGLESYRDYMTATCIEVSYGLPLESPETSNTGIVVFPLALNEDFT